MVLELLKTWQYFSSYYLHVLHYTITDNKILRDHKMIAFWDIAPCSFLKVDISKVRTHSIRNKFGVTNNMKNGDRFKLQRKVLSQTNEWKDIPKKSMAL
jgi:type V secretory pathway adhesin AidA